LDFDRDFDRDFDLDLDLLLPPWPPKLLATDRALNPAMKLPSVEGELSPRLLPYRDLQHRFDARTASLTSRLTVFSHAMVRHRPDGVKTA
jgi:hypothetical protein